MKTNRLKSIEDQKIFSPFSNCVAKFDKVPKCARGAKSLRITVLTLIHRCTEYIEPYFKINKTTLVINFIKSEKSTRKCNAFTFISYLILTNIVVN